MLYMITMYMFLNEQKIKGKIKFMNNLRKKKEINKNNIVHAIKILRTNIKNHFINPLKNLI